MNITEQILDLYNNQAHAAYFGEPMSQQDHALQAAALALADNASPELIIAALLHDIGHLLHSGPEDIAERGIDTRHEIIGARWLQRHFGDAVSEPVRLHVDAKRYLCSADADYFSHLSPASVTSFHLQGGYLDTPALEQFREMPFAQDAIRLRRYDDQAKVPGLEVPPLTYYRAYLDQLALS